MTRDDKELVRRMYSEGWNPEDIAEETAKRMPGHLRSICELFCTRFHVS